MRVLVIGSGAREHALLLALRRDPEVEELAVAPGNAGTAIIADQYDVDITSGDAVAKLAQRIGADLVVIGPEVPLVLGVADTVRAADIACFGPTKEAARIEGSKSFAKEVMAAAGVRTATGEIVDNPAHLDAALDRFGPGAGDPAWVVKDDGLAAGKGVVVTADREAARAHAVGERQHLAAKLGTAAATRLPLREGSLPLVSFRRAAAAAHPLRRRARPRFHRLQASRVPSATTAGRRSVP